MGHPELLGRGENERATVLSDDDIEGASAGKWNGLQGTAGVSGANERAVIEDSQQQASGSGELLKFRIVASDFAKRTEGIGSEKDRAASSNESEGRGIGTNNRDELFVGQGRCGRDDAITGIGKPTFSVATCEEQGTVWQTVANSQVGRAGG